MKKEYDLSKLKQKRRGAVVKADAKVQKTVRLDLDVLSWLMQEGERRGIPYQTLLNALLKERMHASSITERETLRDEIRKIVRQELKKAS
jgi:uncharacterized protein (DUF4415 family)